MNENLILILQDINEYNFFLGWDLTLSAEQESHFSSENILIKY